MKLVALVHTAWSSIGSNRLRTTLTLLGIIIGVSAVIALMSVGRGAQESITARIESLGTNLLFIRPSNDGVLTMADARALSNSVFAPSIKNVAPELQASAVVVFGENGRNIPLFGVTTGFARIRNFIVSQGEFISPAHVIGKNNVVVLGSRAKENLFGTRTPLGSEVLINGLPFTVIGVLESKGANTLGNEDNRVFIPISTAHFKVLRNADLNGDIPLTTINAQAKTGLIESANKEATTLLRLRHKVTEEDDFTVSSQQTVIDALAETTATLTVFLGAVAGISLIVGGIGIMNIMLVSVTERTKEIGIRKAMGASRRDILSQFIIEAVLISLVGGVLGVGLGVIASNLLDGLPLAGTQISTVISADITILALVVSAAIGLFFGIYPASRASKLHPIDALRSV